MVGPDKNLLVEIAHTSSIHDLIDVQHESEIKIRGQRIRFRDRTHLKTLFFRVFLKNYEHNPIGVAFSAG